MSDVHLDCKGLNCPMPIVRLSQAIAAAKSGARIVVEADDPAFQADLEAWVRRMGHVLEGIQGERVKRAVVIKR
jgi:TusA-related sulfurtransferase